MKVWSPCFNMKIRSSRTAGYASSDNLSAFDVTNNRVCKIVGDSTGNAWLLILLPMEMW